MPFYCFWKEYQVWCKRIISYLHNYFSGNLKKQVNSMMPQDLIRFYHRYFIQNFSWTNFFFIFYLKFYVVFFLDWSWHPPWIWPMFSQVVLSRRVHYSRWIQQAMLSLQQGRSQTGNGWGNWHILGHLWRCPAKFK